MVICRSGFFELFESAFSFDTYSSMVPTGLSSADFRLGRCKRTDDNYLFQQVSNPTITDYSYLTVSCPEIGEMSLPSNTSSDILLHFEGIFDTSGNYSQCKTK